MEKGVICYMNYDTEMSVDLELLQREGDTFQTARVILSPACDSESARLKSRRRSYSTITAGRDISACQ